MSIPKDKAQLARRRELINPLAYLISRTRKSEVTEWRVVREPIAEAVKMTAGERVFYEQITDLVIKYAMAGEINERFLLATTQRQMSSSMAASLSAWQQKRENLDDLASLNDRVEDVGPLTREILGRAFELLYNREQLAKATEGRIRALNARVDRKKREIERRRETNFRKDEILVALINVVG